MKKTILSAAIIATTLVSASTVVFATETIDPAHTTIHWAGSLNDIIPGDNIIITGAGGSVEIAVGDLGLKENGTFASTDIILESHEFDSETNIIGAQAEATWALEKVSYAWGDNAISKTVVEVMNTDAVGAESALTIGTEIPATQVMNLSVKNETPLDVTDITDPTAKAQVNVTMTASFPA